MRWERRRGEMDRGEGGEEKDGGGKGRGTRVRRRVTKKGNDRRDRRGRRGRYRREGTRKGMRVRRWKEKEVTGGQV